MAKGPGGTKENPYYAREIKAGKPSTRRISDNHRVANRLEKEGYTVERDLHENGSYFAVIGNKHTENEKTVGRILAENGLSASLDKEGNMTIKLPNNQKLTLPSGDGRINDKYSFEIYSFEGKPNAGTVADGIEHSYKFFIRSPKDSVQSTVAITIATKGSGYHRNHIDEGITEHIRRVKEDGNKANPRFYLHIDEETRKIYYRELKKRE